MARSPSPAGSYSSRRSRPEHDRHARDKRDAPRDYRRRSRSPRGGDARSKRHHETSDLFADRMSSQKHYRDRDYYRDYDRRHDGESYRSDRRDRSRDKHYPPGSSRRDRRDVTRDHDHRSRRDDSRDRHKRRRDDSLESRSKRRKEEDTNGTDTRHTRDRSRESSTPSNKVVDSEEQKKLDRQAKLEAWKQKQAAERAKKAESGATKPFSLSEMDRPLTPMSSVSPSSPSASNAPQSPAPKVVKYDPKNIVKKAINNAASAALGGDLELPKTAKHASASSSRDAQDTGARSMSNGRAQSSKVKGNLGGFDLSQKQAQEHETAAANRGINLDEEVSTRKRLERLPTPPLNAENGLEQGSGTGVDDFDGQDDDTDMVEADNEEESAAAARAAAAKREERLLADSQTQANKPDEIMTGAAEGAMQPNADSADDEDDPLDAFMAGLTATEAPGLGGPKPKKATQEPQTMFENEDNELDAMDINGEDILEGVSKIKKKKEIPTVNHAKMKYDEFRKDFYHAPSELANLTEDEVANLRHELDGIKVRGVDVPTPVQKWSQCGLGVQSLDVIRGLGFEAPTSIQAQALPAIMSGRDVIGIAKTGSGKTIAFLLPMFRHIKDQKALEGLDGPVGLVMTPTRELATQIHKECKPWLKALGLRGVCAYGGAPIKDQIADLKRGAEIIVCTPGRMIDLLAANTGRVTNLRRVTYLVLDEADRMFDMGFEPQVMKIMANIRPQRQTVLFSATFPKTMEALARKTLHKPVEIIVGGRSVVAPEITQLVEVRDEMSKFRRLLELLGQIHSEDDDARSLIFVDRQESAEELMNAVMRKGYPCFSIHGGKDQYDRDSVISDFKAGIFPVMVATSVAARGLDVKQLKMVVNFDCPNHLEDYVHRAGRTGRAGNKGLAVTFITPEQERYSIDIKKALKQSGQEVPEELQKLVDSFTEKVKEGKAQASGLGFGGKGLERLDQERDAVKARERKTYRTGDEEAEEEDKDKAKDDDLKLEKADEIVVKAAASTTTAAAAAPSVKGEAASTGLEAFDLDGKVKVHKREDAAPATTSEDKTKRVNDAVAAINARLRKGGELRGNAPIDNKGPDAGAFHSTFEINDLPQKARWAVTNRTNVAKILEATGTSITTKGNFYPPGKTPGSTEPPKLYILVEGDTELVVTQAVSELRRLAKDGMVAALNTEARAPASGRYSVV